MSALDDIHRKLLNEMDDIEIAIWYTSGATTAYNMEAAAAKLADLRAENERLKATIQRIEKLKQTWKQEEKEIELPPYDYGAQAEAYTYEKHITDLAAALTGDA